jgi:tetrathionate reductase subunit B
LVRYGMLIDINRCIGCSICVKACKDEHANPHLPHSLAQPVPSYGFAIDSFGWPQTPQILTPWVTPGHLWMKLDEHVRGSFPSVQVHYLPQPCMHCDPAPCIQASLKGAVFRRPDGIILIDPEKSHGQKHLVNACPYHRIYYNTKQQIPQKCTFCAHLIDLGQLPRCVTACPLKVILFGDLHDANSLLVTQIRALNAQPLHNVPATNPVIYYTNYQRISP